MVLVKINFQTVGSYFFIPKFSRFISENSAVSCELNLSSLKYFTNTFVSSVSYVLGLEGTHIIDII